MRKNHTEAAKIAAQFYHQIVRWEKATKLVRRSIEIDDQTTAVYYEPLDLTLREWFIRRFDYRLVFDSENQFVFEETEIVHLATTLQCHALTVA